MQGSRTLTALAGITGSIAVSVVVYVYTGSLLLFFFIPFIPFLFLNRGGEETDSDRRRPPVRECSRCGFTIKNPEFEYCPRDGSRLSEPAHRSEAPERNGLSLR